MSVKFLKIQLNNIVLGLAIVLAAVSVMGAAGPAQASTASSSTDCLNPLSLQEQAACNEETQTVAGFGTVVAWLFPSAEEKITPRNQAGILGKDARPERGLQADDLSTTGLMLFGAALVGIVFLGRRRRKAQRH